MRSCPKCGAALPDGASFCGACGTPAVPLSTSAPVSGAPTQSLSASSEGRTTISPKPEGLCAGPYDDPDRYQLVQLRSRGGEGELWRSTLSIDGVPLPVAVKVINEANNDRLEDWSRRWQQQAEILKTLDHPSLVKVRDTFEGPVPHAPGMADSNSRSLFLVMNWVNGESLVEWVARNPGRDLLDSTRIIARIAGAVDYLHSGASMGKAVLHRDIKPANVLIDGNNICLVDFGFARLMSGEPMTLAGTPYYMAPEVVGGGVFGEASDRYALGATAYYTIVGEPPTLGDFAGMRVKLTRARGVDGRVDLADHVLAMMNPDPAQRPANTVEWAQALAAGAVSTSLPTQALSATTVMAPPVAASEPPKRRKRRGLLITVLLLAIVLVIGAGVAYAFVGRDKTPEVPFASPSASASVTPSPSVSSSPSPSWSPSESASPSPEISPSSSSPSPSADGLVIMNLSQFAEPVAGSVDTGQATMKTKPYFYSLWMHTGYYGQDQSVEYNVPPGFDTFQATIGMDDSSGSSAKTTFQITNAITGEYLFGGPGHLVTVKMNEVRSVDLTLPSDILRIKLSTVSRASGDAWDVGVHPVWGDAQLTGPQGGQAELPIPIDN